MNNFNTATQFIKCKLYQVDTKKTNLVTFILLWILPDLVNYFKYLKWISDLYTVISCKINAINSLIFNLPVYEFFAGYQM